MRLSSALLLILLGAAPAPAQPGDSAKLCALTPPLAEQLTKISGMPLRHAVPCAFITKEKIKEFLNKRVKEVAKPEDLRAEELTLKKLDRKSTRLNSSHRLPPPPRTPPPRPKHRKEKKERPQKKRRKESHHPGGSARRGTHAQEI